MSELLCFPTARAGADNNNWQEQPHLSRLHTESGEMDRRRHRRIISPSQASGNELDCSLGSDRAVQRQQQWPADKHDDDAARANHALFAANSRARTQRRYAWQIMLIARASSGLVILFIYRSRIRHLQC